MVEQAIHSSSQGKYRFDPNGQDFPVAGLGTIAFHLVRFSNWWLLQDVTSLLIRIALRTALSC